VSPRKPSRRTTLGLGILASVTFGSVIIPAMSASTAHAGASNSVARTTSHQARNVAQFSARRNLRRALSTNSIGQGIRHSDWVLERPWMPSNGPSYLEETNRDQVGSFLASRQASRNRDTSKRGTSQPTTPWSTDLVFKNELLYGGEPRSNRSETNSEPNTFHGNQAGPAHDLGDFDS